MRFGIFDHLERMDGVPLPRLFAERLELVRLADEGGITGYHLAEHHGSELCMAPSQETFLGAVAAATTRLRLGPLVKCLPLHHPLRLLEDICILDNLSGGRLDYGVGRGTAPSEHVFFSQRWQDAEERFEESLELLVRGLRTGKLDTAGCRYYDFPTIETAMEPVQQPNPPFWYPTRDPASAGRRGMSCLLFSRVSADARARYLEAWADHRDTPGWAAAPAQQPVIGNADIVAIAATASAAEEIARRGQEGLQRRVLAAHEYDARVIPKDQLAEALGPRPRRVSHSLPAGTVEMVRDYYVQYAEEGTADYVALMIPTGDMTHRESMETLEAFCNEVLPAVARVEDRSERAAHGGP